VIDGSVEKGLYTRRLSMATGAKEKMVNPVFGYRWVILAVYMLLSIVIQIQWLAHAAVARPAEVFYQGQFNPDGLFNIDILALL